MLLYDFFYIFLHFTKWLSRQGRICMPCIFYFESTYVTLNVFYFIVFSKPPVENKLEHYNYFQLSQLIDFLLYESLNLSLIWTWNRTFHTRNQLFSPVRSCYDVLIFKISAGFSLAFSTSSDCSVWIFFRSFYYFISLNFLMKIIFRYTCNFPFYVFISSFQM